MREEDGFFNLVLAGSNVCNCSIHSNVHLFLFLCDEVKTLTGPGALDEGGRDGARVGVDGRRGNGRRQMWRLTRSENEGNVDAIEGRGVTRDGRGSETLFSWRRRRR